MTAIVMKVVRSILYVFHFVNAASALRVRPDSIKESLLPRHLSKSVDFDDSPPSYTEAVPGAAISRTVSRSVSGSVDLPELPAYTDFKHLLNMEPSIQTRVPQLSRDDMFAQWYQETHGEDLIERSPPVEEFKKTIAIVTTKSK